MKSTFHWLIALTISFSTCVLAAPAHPEIGLYRLQDGTNVDISWLQEINSLIFVRLPSGRIGPLHQVGDELVGGPSLGAPEPVTFRARIDGDAIVWHETRATLTGKRVHFRSEDVRMVNGAVTLAGTLIMPNSQPPYPAVVLIHGGGPQTRDGFLWVANLFASHGVAVLAYDKRGSGASTGDWQTANARDLASDALVGVDLLRAHIDIDRKRIGLYGSSNGGWVAPLAATMAPKKIGFIIVRSASGFPERRNIIYEVESDLLAHGMADAVPKMKAMHEQDIALLKDPSHWNDLRDAIERVAKEPWFQYARLPHPMMEMNDVNRKHIEGWIADQRASWIDPAQLWTKIHVPVLDQIGSADESAPGEQSARILRMALAKNPRATVTLYHNGTHPIFESTGGRPPDYGRVQRFVPGYLTDLGDWIDANISGRKSSLPIRH